MIAPQKNSRNLRARFSFPIHLLMAWEMSGHGLSNFDEGISCPRNEAVCVCVCGETCMAGKSFIPISFSNLSASHPQRLSAPKICIFRSITKKRRDAHVFIESCSKMTRVANKNHNSPRTQRTAIYRYNSMFCIVT